MDSSHEQMSLGSQQERGGPSNSPSPVLLVCVYDTIVFEITNELIYSRFQEYGNIVKLLIFDKREVTKLFIEFSTT